MIRAAVLTGLLLATIAPLQDNERIEINGAKHPEQIPEWAAWSSTFETLSRASGLPLTIRQMATDAEAALIMSTAKTVHDHEVTCIGRIERDLRPLLGKESVESLRAKQQAIHVECRWNVLRARDDLFARLTAPTIEAMTDFMERGKAGTTVSLLRRDLAEYRQPQ